MKKRIFVRQALSTAILLTVVLPAQVLLAGTSTDVGNTRTTIKKIQKTKATKIFVTNTENEKKKEAKTNTPETGSPTIATRKRKEELSSSTLLKIGGGTAIAAGLIALAAGGGGGGNSKPEPLTADRFVSAWKANGDQPGSGRTYIGEYHLYSGGAISYAVNISSGEQFAGGGNWSLSGDQLTIRTDHGSIYSGSITPGDYNMVNLNSNTGWNLHLTR